MHSCVTSKNVKWCHLIWPTLYAVARPSVRLSVRLTVTRLDQSKTVEVNLGL